MGFEAVQSHFCPRYPLKVNSPELKQKFQQGEVPLPSFWGGFRVSLEQIEFWQGGEHRLHDRFCTSEKMMRGRLIVLHPEKMQKSCFNRWYS